MALTLALAFLAAFFAVLLFWLASRRQRAAGLPGGKVIYADTRAWGPLEEPLYDAHLGLTGKPDYLVQQGERVIPVEVKSKQVSDGPLDSHIYQLAAYCLLVSRVYGKRPPHGILHYPNRTYQIEFTPALEASTLALLEEMRTLEHRKTADRSHESANRCSRCGHRSICDQKLR